MSMTIDKTQTDAIIDKLLGNNDLAASPEVWYGLHQIKELPVTEIVRCDECAYYDPPHVENNGVRYEYAEMPKDAFDVLGTGLVTTEYGINIGGRCCRDYNAGYDDDKRVFVPENNFCGRAERRTE